MCFCVGAQSGLIGMNEEAAVFDTALFGGLNTRFSSWTVNLSGPGAAWAQFQQKTLALRSPLSPGIESLIILTLNRLLETKLWAHIGGGKYSCQKRKTKRRSYRGRSGYLFTLINSCLNFSDDIRSPLCVTRSMVLLIITCVNTG